MYPRYIYIPTLCNVLVYRKLRIGYFAQHHIDQLVMDTTSVELLQSRHPGNTMEAYRAHLGSYGITGDLALRPVAFLSGGQKSRLAFALMTYPRYVSHSECQVVHHRLCVITVIGCGQICKSLRVLSGI